VRADLTWSTSKTMKTDDPLPGRLILIEWTDGERYSPPDLTPDERSALDQIVSLSWAPECNYASKTAFERTLVPKTPAEPKAPSTRRPRRKSQQDPTLP
jgi:hypothetical protein